MMMTTHLRGAWLVGLTLALMGTMSIAVAAQTVVNPKRVIFTASTDHAATEPITGQPMVTKYLLQIIAVGATGPITEVDLGKPTPDGNGDIMIEPGALLALPVGVKYQAVVLAVGPGGQAASTASDPFGRPKPAAAPGRPKIQG